MVHHLGLPQLANLFQLPAEYHGQAFVRARWGSSYNCGLEWLLHHDPSPIITVTGPQSAIIYVNLFVLSPEQQKRILLINSSAACYYLTTCRWHPQFYADSLGPKVLAYRQGRETKMFSILPARFAAPPTAASPQRVGAPALRTLKRGGDRLILC